MGFDTSLVLQNEKNKKYISYFKPLAEARGHNFELIIDNFELSRSDLTARTRRARFLPTAWFYKLRLVLIIPLDGTKGENLSIAHAHSRASFALPNRSFEELGGRKQIKTYYLLLENIFPMPLRESIADKDDISNKNDQENLYL